MGRAVTVGPARRPDKGPALVLGPEEGASYWQPPPSLGYVTVKLSPFTSPSNVFSAGMQVIDPGCALREHAHQRNEELLFVHEGTGTAIVDGRRYGVSPGSVVYVGRWVTHGFVNEGPGPMKVFWVFFPPGLETVLSAIGQPRQPGQPRPAVVERPANVAEILDRGWFAPPDSASPGGPSR